jgi:hypothetical protein
MRNFMTLIVATSVALSSAMASYADKNPLPKDSDVLVRYGEDVEGWTVYANQTRGDCLIVRKYGPDAIGAVQMGVTANQEVGYLGVFTKADIGVKRGTKSQIFVSIDGNVYSGVVTSTKAKGGYSGGYILTDDPNFKRDVAKKYTMIVFPETKGAFVVDLKGTFKAMAMGRKCLNN